jgi:hypothetical protein
VLVLAINRAPVLARGSEPHLARMLGADDDDSVVAAVSEKEKRKRKKTKTEKVAKESQQNNIKCAQGTHGA